MKRAILSIACVSLIICSAAIAAKAWSYRSIAIEAQHRLQTTDLIYPATAALLVKRDAGLPLTDEMGTRESVLAIREYIYRGYALGDEELPDKNPAAYYMALGSQQNGMKCGGASVAYTWALNSVGIPARTVQLAGKNFLAGRDLYQTHVTVEAMIDGKWEISDPSFNVAIRCSDSGDENLSVHGVRACLARGERLNYVPGKTQTSDKMVKPDEYPFYFAAFTRRSVSAGDVNESEEAYPTGDWIAKAMTAY